MATVRLVCRSCSYPIITGVGASDRLTNILRKHSKESRIFTVYDAQFYSLHGDTLRGSILRESDKANEFVVPSGERSKSQQVLAGLYDFLISLRISRSDFLLALGGGVTTDLVGYAAATILRGIRWGAVPTTLLGMIDAAIGGKTGINHAMGKNLIGAFWHPSFVVSDVRFLSTLSRRQMVSGMGEVLKYAGLAGGATQSTLKKLLDSDDLYDMKGLASLVEQSAAYKAAVVARDERDAGKRMVLNFGHTVGHGIETALGYGKLLHGEAVVLGILSALRIGRALGIKSRGLDQYRDLVERMIRRVPKRNIELRTVLTAMSLDKKRLDGAQRYVLLNRIGRPILRDGINSTLVRDAVKDTLAEYRILGGTDA